MLGKRSRESFEDRNILENEFPVQILDFLAPYLDVETLISLSQVCTLFRNRLEERIWFDAYKRTYHCLIDDFDDSDMNENTSSTFDNYWRNHCLQRFKLEKTNSLTYHLRPFSHWTTEAFKFYSNDNSKSPLLPENHPMEEYSTIILHKIPRWTTWLQNHHDFINSIRSHGLEDKWFAHGSYFSINDTFYVAHPKDYPKTRTQSVWYLYTPGAKRIRFEYECDNDEDMNKEILLEGNISFSLSVQFGDVWGNIITYPNSESSGSENEDYVSSPQKCFEYLEKYLEMGKNPFGGNFYNYCECFSSFPGITPFEFNENFPKLDKNE